MIHNNHKISLLTFAYQFPWNEDVYPVGIYDKCLRNSERYRN